MKKAGVTFAPGLGHVEDLVAKGLLKANGSLTDLGLEVLLVHGMASPRVAQDERVCADMILSELANGPAALHELYGEYDEKCEQLRMFRIEGLVEKLPGDRFALTDKGKAVAPAPEPVGEPVEAERRRTVSREIKAACDRVTLSLSDVVRRGDRTDGDRWAVLAGDVLERLAGIPDWIADMVVTSPPYYKYRNYGFGQMGDEATPELYVEGQVKVLVELKKKIANHGLIWYVIQDKLLGRRLLGVVHDIVSEAKKAGLILVNESIWAKDACLANSSGGNFTMGHEFILVFAKSMDYYWSPVRARELGTRGVMRNAYSVQRFSRKKEPWQNGHDATFPPSLVQFALRCGASNYGRCRCGEPWEDVTVREAREYLQRKTCAPADKKVVELAPRCEGACGHPKEPEPLLILDPFCGTATTGMVSLAYGRAKFLGIECQAKFVEKSAVNLRTISPERAWRKR